MTPTPAAACRSSDCGDWERALSANASSTAAKLPFTICFMPLSPVSCRLLLPPNRRDASADSWKQGTIPFALRAKLVKGAERFRIAGQNKIDADPF